MKKILWVHLMIGLVLPAPVSGGPLHAAAASRDSKEVRRLLSEGDDPDGKDQEGNGVAPLHLAVQKQDLSVTRLLLDAGADVNARNKNLSTPLHFAAAGDSETILRLLLARGADLDPRDNNTNTPLHFAAIFNKRALAEILLSAGAAVDARDKRGVTPLHMASLKGYLAMAKLLLDRGADIEAETGPNIHLIAGYSPLDIALFKGNNDLAAMLVRYGAPQQHLHRVTAGEFEPVPPAVPMKVGEKEVGN